MKDPELDALFRETLSELSQEHCQPDADDPSRKRFTLTHESGVTVTVTLRVKPDRRSVVTRVAPGAERRRS